VKDIRITSIDVYVSGVDEIRFVALYEWAVVGTVGLQVRADSAAIRQMYVRPDMRREGVGTALLKACLERIRKTSNCEAVSLQLSLLDADGALPFYRRHGFVVVATIIEHLRQRPVPVIVRVAGKVAEIRQLLNQLAGENDRLIAVAAELAESGKEEAMTGEVTVPVKEWTKTVMERDRLKLEVERLAESIELALHRADRAREDRDKYRELHRQTLRLLEEEEQGAAAGL
jgi:ribosomal protein S18 acetylase RimI-like enzyme